MHLRTVFVYIFCMTDLCNVSVSMSICPSVCVSFCLSLYLSMYPSTSMPICQKLILILHILIAEWMIPSQSIPPFVTSILLADNSR